MVEVNRARTPLAVPVLTGLSVALLQPGGQEIRSQTAPSLAADLNRPAATRPLALSQPDVEQDWFAQWPTELEHEVGMDVFMRPPAVREVEVVGRIERENVLPPEWEF